MLKRVSIQNFKSLKDVTLDLQKVNLLIGPNNSGKTNFLKALETFDSIDNGRINDFELISFNHLNNDIFFEFLFTPNADGLMSRSRPETLGKDYLFKKRTYIKNDEGFSSFSVNSEIDDYFVDSDANKLDTIEVLGGHRREFFDYIKSKVYRPDPSKLEHSAKLTGNEISLEANGSNLIASYFYIYNNYEELANSIQTDLSRCIPEIISFRTPPLQGDSLLGLKFFTNNTNFWASEVSEGVLYFLILLCIINQPNPPKLLLLEEPEKGIHPRRIWEVMKFIFQLAEEKDVQIIMTTHNEHVVNAFSSIPESVFVFDKDEETGATSVRNLQKDIIEPTDRINEELGLDKFDLTSNLGEYWMYGLIGGVPSNVQ